MATIEMGSKWTAVPSACMAAGVSPGKNRRKLCNKSESFPIFILSSLPSLSRPQKEDGLIIMSPQDGYLNWNSVVLDLMNEVRLSPGQEVLKRKKQ